MLNDAGKVFVGGLSPEVTQEEISEKFEKFGRIEKIWVARQPPGFGMFLFSTCLHRFLKLYTAFVHFESSEEADEACAALNDVDGWRVEKARPRRPGGGRGGYGGRGGGGGGYGGYDRGGDRYDRGGDYRDRYDRRDYGGERSYDRSSYDRGSGGRERYGDRDGGYRERDYRG